MLARIRPGPDTGLPSTEDIKLAKRAAKKLATVRAGAGPVPVRFGPDETVTVDIPPTALRLIKALLASMANGNGVMMSSLKVELAPGQAAQLLGVPLEHMLELLDSGEIPFRKEGAFQLVRTDDIMAYRREMRARRRKALDEMTARDQAMGLQ